MEPRMPFLFLIERRSYSDSLEKRLVQEDEFLDAHGGWGPQLTCRIFDAAGELIIRGGALFEVGRRSPQPLQPERRP